MKATCITLLLLLGSVTQPPRLASDSADRSTSSKADPGRREVQKVLPRLDAIAKEDRSNVEVRLGLGILYESYPASLQDTSRAEEQWRDILRIEPNNGPAWALLTTSDVLMRGGRYRERLGILEAMIASAEKGGQKYIQIDGRVNIHRRWRPSDVGGSVTTGEVPSPQTPSPLYEYFADDSGRDVILKDFDAARKTLKDKLRQELRDGMQTAVKAERADPDNALYGYLRAYLYYLLEEDEAALAQVRTAAQKRYLNTYLGERRRAVSNVLRLVAFPDQLRQEIEETYTPIASVLSAELLRKHIFPLARKYEEQGDAKRAAELYTVVLQMAKQIREEPTPYPFEYNQKLSQLLERRVQERNQNP